MKTSYGRKWYAEGLRFECQRCGACCAGQPGYVWVTPPEAARMASWLGMPRVEFAGKYLRNAGSHDSLIELPDGRCIFYADKRCTIYRVRPVQCRTFPFWRSIIASPEAWRRCQEKCPGMGKGRLYSAAEVEEIVRLSSGESSRPELYPR
ncbi:YkgJ family cysteine cluster protein [bacterium]|nr:YkgJ family cysteine cluster protein [bacterium]